ncbi:hypothetical protein MB901379_00765 [Mycobacterium basiliense]|uniref:FG-GAP repeat n=1 Tax=Mycobacterium basiliense TaxID=2094119 RepID=A0A447G9R9_9MYCO|nr:hypothetical protein [Mycobacterium basiliense]VDM87230.1 hypothetical protein MB901379_00765 [Mycobacterium basiliense]
MRRVVLVSLLVAACVGAPAPARSFAAAGCPPGGPPPPVDANERQVGDLDGDGRPDTLWIGLLPKSDGSLERLVGISTASGTNTAQPILSASPIPLRALAIDAENNGAHQVIVSDGRSAGLYAFAECRLQTVVASHDGQPFRFDLENLAGNGTGIGCSKLGAGRRLVGLQALQDGELWTVRRTEINLNGTLATIGRSDTLTAVSAQDPVVTSAETISCGDLTIDQDGVQQP